MNEDVIAHGDDRPPRRFGGLLAGAAAFALLGVGVAGALRSPEPASDAAPSPSATRTAGWTEYPPGPAPNDPFAVFVSAHRPADGEAVPLLLDGGMPVLLVGQGDAATAYVAVGGTSYAPVLLGWCRANGMLEDAAGEFRYLYGQPSRPDATALRTYRVRDGSGAAGSHVDIATGRPPEPLPSDSYGDFARGCTKDELVLPALPGTSDDLYRAGSGWARMRGRYVVSTESRAFCPAGADAQCDSSGWEEYGPHTVLPPSDLASAYTWEGEFLVRTDPSRGAIEVVRTPDTRLTRRERVGTSVRVGWVETWERRGGTLRLAFNPFAASGVPDDSPPGTPRPERLGLVDERGGLVSYTVRPDAEVYLGLGLTGLGKPRGTPATLEAYLRTARPYVGQPLWLVLDARGRVMRVVLAPKEG